MRALSCSLFAASALLAFAACTEPTAMVVHIAPAPASTLPAPGSRAPAAIVWIHHEDGIHSQWLEEGEGGPVVKLERAEPVIAAASGLYAYRTRELSLGTVRGCHCDPGAPSGCDKSITTTEATAVHLGTGRAVALGSPDAPEACEGLASHAGEVSLVGAAGSLVFLSVSSEETCCDAAHPMFRAHAVAFDLDALRPVTLAPPKETLPLLAKRAREQLLREAGGCLTDINETAELYSARFEYDDTGHLAGHYAFTMSAAYACATGPGHYASVTDVVDAALPDEVGKLRSAPAWLTGWLASHPVVGLSVLPVELDRLAAFRQMESIVKR